MAVTSKKMTIGTTAIQLVAPDNVRQDVQIHAKHAFYLGGDAGVSSTNGFLVDNGDELWGIADNEGTSYLLISAQT